MNRTVSPRARAGADLCALHADAGAASPAGGRMRPTERFMTVDANPMNVTHLSADAALPPLAASTILVQCYLSLALRFDYLSTGRGHRQSRRVVRDRLTAAAKASATAPRRPDTAPGLAGPTDPAALTEDAERRYLSEVAGKPRLTSREEYCLVGLMRSGDRAAYEALIGANLGLVVMIARRYQRPGVPLLDLIAEGNFGLMRAAERFDREIGCRFSTYASWWVRQAIQLAMPKLSSVVRTPLSQTRATAAANAAAGAHEAGAAAALDDVDPALVPPLAELTRDAARPDGREAAAPAGVVLVDDAEERAAAAARAGQSTEPFYRGGDDEGSRSDANDADVLNSLAIDPDEEPPGPTLARQRLRALYGALDQLPERDRVIIVSRYALDSDRPSTLDELSQRFGVSVERIRQLENAAVKKLAKLLSQAGESADSLL